MLEKSTSEKIHSLVSSVNHEWTLSVPYVLKILEDRIPLMLVADQVYTVKACTNVIMYIGYV